MEDKSSAVSDSHRLSAVRGSFSYWCPCAVLFMLLMAVSPVPILPLLFVLEAFVIDICPVAHFQPMPVNPVLALIPVVIVLVIGVVYSSFLCLPLVISVILRRRHGKFPSARSVQQTQTVTLNTYFRDAVLTVPR